MFKSSGNKKQLNVIEPNKCIIDDLEILAFETEEQLKFYTVWHEALVDKRRELNATNERERQIIKNEIAKKKEVSISVAGIAPARQPVEQPTHKIAPVVASEPRLKLTRDIRPKKFDVGLRLGNHQQRPGALYPPKGLQVFNPCQPNQSSNVASSPGGAASKQGMKYKLTKLYNKYRGRQARRNFVLEKQRNARIEHEIAKSYINPWMAYTALQALRLPDSNVSTLSTTTNNTSKILTPLAQPSASGLTPPPSPALSTKSTKKSKASVKKQQAAQGTAAQAQQTANTKSSPMHLVYIDPVNLITYSNRINPQQIAEYRQKSHLLPSSATSKKSSAASYDAYEIMEVLANTNKTNVTITRNANRPLSAGSNTSVYSHSVNSNTPGIVSTQLHLQARSYLDSMRQFYAEEAERLAQEKEKLDQEPPPEEIIGRYINLDCSHSTLEPKNSSRFSILR